MKVELYTNTYGHKRLKCPFCDYEGYARDSMLNSADPLRGIKTHIKNAAQKEALAFLLNDVKKEADTPHLKYFREHSITKKVVDLEKRELDNSLKL